MARSYALFGGQCCVPSPGFLKFDHGCLSPLFRRVTRPHGNSGVVRAKFRNNIPPHAFGASVRVVSNFPSGSVCLVRVLRIYETFINCRCFIHQISEHPSSCCFLWRPFIKARSSSTHCRIGRCTTEQTMYPHCMNMNMVMLKQPFLDLTVTNLRVRSSIGLTRMNT